jgi:hypothetical protein
LGSWQASWRSHILGAERKIRSRPEPLPDGRALSRVPAKEIGMSEEKKTGRSMENAHTLDPLNPESGNKSLNSEVHATTAHNSSVKPEEYPKKDRDQQVRVATGKPASEEK